MKRHPVYAQLEEAWSALKDGAEFTKQDLADLASVNKNSMVEMKACASFIQNKRKTGRAEKVGVVQGQKGTPAVIYKRYMKYSRVPAPSTPKQKEPELDLIDIGASILALIQDKDKEITRLKETVKEMRSDLEFKDKEIRRTAAHYQEAQTKIHDLNEKLLKGKKGISLHELQESFNGGAR